MDAQQTRGSDQMKRRVLALFTAGMVALSLFGISVLAAANDETTNQSSSQSAQEPAQTVLTGQDQE